MTTDDATLPGTLASDPKIIQLRPKFRLQIGYVLAELEGQGFQPRIANAYRSAAEQLEKYKKGYSKSKKPGHHTFGLAADIIDRRVGWPDWDDKDGVELAAAFAHALRDACDKHDVACGGWWKQTNPGWARHDLGWDPFHTWDHKAPKSMRVEYGPEQWGSGLVEVGRDA